MNKLPPKWYRSTEGIIAIVATISLILSIALRTTGNLIYQDVPLYFSYIFGGIPLVYDLFKKALRGEFGSDLIAGISIITSILLGEHLAGVFVILMLSGGEALEAYALRRASSVLDAVSKRMPSGAFLKTPEGTKEVTLDQVKLDDLIEVHPHRICPVDGIVVSGHSSMDESFLTGEPYFINKVPGTTVISGAINGESLITIRATALPKDSRYQKIAKVIEEQAGQQVPIRRIGNMLGAWYTPIAVIIAITAWLLSGDPKRFLAVLVVATPCPLLIAIPVALIGAISSAASRGIIVKKPAVLEILPKCKTIFLDKTGTLTYGKPLLTTLELGVARDRSQALQVLASLEQYSKHPLASAVMSAAKENGLELSEVDSISEPPGAGLTGRLNGKNYTVTSRKKTPANLNIPEFIGGMECVVLEDGDFFALARFKDIPRHESKAFVEDLKNSHGIQKVKILSGDRTGEVEEIAKQIGITDLLGSLSPEEKLHHISEATKNDPVIYVGDGINDAPALQAATVGIAIGTNSEITSESADLVILDSSLGKVDDIIHISRSFRSIALQSAIGGMLLSIVGMGFAAVGILSPLWGAITQEAIDVFAVLNALRTSFLSKTK